MGGADAPDMSTFSFLPDMSGTIGDSTTEAVAGDPLEVEEQDIFTLGKAYFDSKEFERTAALLKDCRSNKSRFLCLYSRYLVRSMSNTAVVRAHCM